MTPKPKRKALCKVIDIPLYPAAVALCVGTTKEVALKFFMKSFSLTNEAGLSIHDCRGVSMSADNNGHLIYMPEWIDSVSNYGTLAHECLHVTHRVLNTLGCKQFGWENDEPVTYLHSFIFESCLREILKEKR